MTKTPIAYGIDFGTTNSALAIAYSDRSTDVISMNDGQPLMPSLLYLNRDGNRLGGSSGLRGFLDTATRRTSCGTCVLEPVRGRDACRQRQPGSGCLDARLLSQIKSSLTDPHFTSTHSWGIDFELGDMVAAVLATLKRQADRQIGTDVRRVVLGRPVRFVGAEGPAFEERQRLACDRLTQAARRAGFEEVELLAESQAAVALDEIDSGVAVCTDFGGGTFDVAVVDVIGSRGNVLALDGVAVGGEEFDAKIFDHVLRPVLGLDAEFRLADGQTRRLPSRLQHQLRSLSGLKVLLTEPEVTRALTDYLGRGHDRMLRQVGDLLFGGQAWMFYKAIEAAKIALSTSDQTTIEFRRHGFDLDVPLSRRQFEEIIARDLDLVRGCLEDALDASRVDTDEVAYVTRTGGSSRIPAFAALLEEMFPQAKLVDRDPFTCVVTGLAQYAVGKWAQ